MPEDRKHGRMRVLAVASGGGHWVQLLRIMPAFADCDVIFATVHKAYRTQVPTSPLYVLNDATRWNKFGVLVMALRLFSLILRQRPDIVVSTGAAPGYVALRIGRLFGARTIWIDSIANVQGMSMSGTRIGRHADLWLTQWPHLAKPDGPQYGGSVL
jgi:hypothetical protein